MTWREVNPRYIVNADGTPVDETNPFNVTSGRISGSNGYSTLITNGGTFTGEWEDVGLFDSLTVAVKTDQDGYFEVQFSPNGVNVDSTLTRYYRTAQIEAPHRFTITRKYFRIVFYNNSGADQTYFRLQTLVGIKQQLNAPTDSNLAQDFDAVVTRPTDFKYEVALGRRQGYTTWNKWGYNPDIDILSSPETVWSAGGLFQRMTVAAELDIIFANANDTAAGTGARGVILYGIDENYDEQIAVFPSNGGTVTTTGYSWLGINRMAVYAAGTSGYNEGVITAVVTGGGSTQAHMPATEGTTQQAFIFIPRAHKGLFDWLFLNVVKIAGGGGAKPEITFRAFVTSLVSNSRYEVFRDIVDVAIENHTELSPAQPFVVGEKSLLEFQASTNADNTVASARFSGVIVRDVNA